MKKIKLVNLLGLILILILIVTGVIVFIRNKQKTTNTQTENQIQDIETQSEQINKTDENSNIDETDNETSTETPEETLEEEPKTAEEKALAVVKNDWDEKNCEFSVTGMDNDGSYIIQVTDSETKVLAFYTVNVEKNVFSKEIME